MNSALTNQGQTRLIRKPMAAVVGAAREEEAAVSIARELGRALVDAGFRLVTGGLGGVMRGASMGARQSKAYVEGDIIGILPKYDGEDVNEFVDITICTGLNHARNIVVVASADVVLAVGGRSGTLSEIAFAWTLGKPVICVGEAPGWAAKLAGSALDDRREDIIHGPMDPVEAARLARELLDVLHHKSKEF